MHVIHLLSWDEIIQFNSTDFLFRFQNRIQNISELCDTITWKYFYRPLNHLVCERLLYPLPSPLRGEAGQERGDSSCRSTLLADHHLKPPPPLPPPPHRFFESCPPRLYNFSIFLSVSVLAYLCFPNPKEPMFNL
jgi:hypothetical protein